MDMDRSTAEQAGRLANLEATERELAAILVRVAVLVAAADQLLTGGQKQIIHQVQAAAGVAFFPALAVQVLAILAPVALLIIQVEALAAVIGLVAAAAAGARLVVPLVALAAVQAALVVVQLLGQARKAL